MGIPCSRPQKIISARASQLGSCPPISRWGSSMSSAPSGSLTFFRSSRVKRHVRYFSAITPDTQRDLLAHGPAWHEYRGLFPQQSGDFSFKVVDDLAFAVAITEHAWIDTGGKVAQNLLWRLPVVAAQKTGTCLVDFVVGIHGGDVLSPA